MRDFVVNTNAIRPDRKFLIPFPRCLPIEIGFAPQSRNQIESAANDDEWTDSSGTTERNRDWHLSHIYPRKICGNKTETRPTYFLKYRFNFPANREIEKKTMEFLYTDEIPWRDHKYFKVRWITCRIDEAIADGSDLLYPPKERRSRRSEIAAARIFFASHQENH